MAISNRLNKPELTGFLVQEELITTGDLVSDNLGTGGLLTVGEKGIDGFSPIVTISYISGSESSTGLSGYNINITDVNSPYYGQDFQIYNGNGIKSAQIVTTSEGECHLLLTFDNGDYWLSPENIRGEKGDPGTTDYNELENKPSINSIELSGDKSLEELGIQGQLTEDNAGDGISITVDSTGKTIISNTNVSAEWGNIQGDITDQIDLVNYIDNHGGKIDSISVNGINQPIDSAKNVDIDLRILDCGTSTINV